MKVTEKLQQIRTEYEEGRSFLENKKQDWVDDLELMTNLQRPDQTIASTMLFSFFTRVHSNLYDPEKQVKFEPNEETEMHNVEMTNKLFTSDWQEMDMAIIEYDWLWDALFFGRGYLETLNFNKKRKILEPTVINPLAFYYDSFFSASKNWRYYGKWISRGSNQVKRLIDSKVITGIKKCTEIVDGMDPEFWNYKVLREQARNVNPQGPDSSAVMPASASGNGIYQILEHYTHFEGVKHVVWTDRNITKILRDEELDLNDDPDNEGESLWPIVVREISREPHSSVPLSIPDLIQDKHRAQNVLLNLSYIAAKDEVTPIYVYDEDAIVNPSQLLSRQILQHIAIEGGKNVNEAIAALKKSPGMSNSLLGFMNIIKNESAEAIGTSQVSPPVQKGKKSATGDALMQQVADLTAALQTKIIGNSSKQFASHWYQRYIHNLKEGDEKIISITNSQFTTFESIKLDNIKTKNPPKMIAFSAREAEFKEKVERQELSQQFPILQQVMSPDNFIKMLKYVYFPKMQTFDSAVIDLIFPKSIEEIKAEQENELLARGELPPISDSDDHETHLYIHSRVKNNAAKWSHYLTHEIMLGKQQAAVAAQAKANPPANPGQQQTGPGGAQENQNNEAAVPAKGAMDKSLKKSGTINSGKS